jgi:hypothetical protein
MTLSQDFYNISLAPNTKRLCSFLGSPGERVQEYLIAFLVGAFRPEPELIPDEKLHLGDYVLSAGLIYQTLVVLLELYFLS